MWPTVVSILNLIANAATVVGVYLALLALDEQRVATAWSLIAAAKVEGGNIGLIERLQGLVHRASFKGIKLPGAHLAKVNLPGVDLEGADLSRADLIGANLRGANLNGADFRQADLQRSDLSHAQLRGAIFDESDLTGANLKDADLRGAILIKARLLSTNLQGAQLALANFTGANLSDARLGRAKLDGARFDHAIMHRTDLQGTNLPRVIFRDADLRRANLTNTQFVDAVVYQVDFANACGDSRTAGLPDGITLVQNDRWCGPPAEPLDMPPANANVPTVYYLVATLIDEWQTESQKTIERVFSDLKPHYTVITLDAHEDAELQNRQLAAAIRAKPAIIILNAVDGSKIDGNLIKSARSASKIPILAYDRPVDAEVDFTSITDARGTGEKAAKSALELVNGPNSPSGASILQILGDPVDQWSRAVQIGFERTLADAVQYVPVISRPAMQWDPGKAAKIARDQLKLNPNIRVVYAHSADLADAVIDFLKTESKRPGDIKVIASNGAPLGLKNMSDCSPEGACWQELEIDQPVYAQVYALALFHDEIVKGQSNTLTARTCAVLGFRGRLSPDKERGPVFTLSVDVIKKKDVDDRNPRFWGNMVPPEGIIPEPCPG
jgi:ribose transport system substrate-binding protein